MEELGDRKMAAGSVGKELVCWFSTHWVTEQTYLNLFSCMKHELYMVIIAEIHFYIWIYIQMSNIYIVKIYIQMSMLDMLTNRNIPFISSNHCFLFFNFLVMHLGCLRPCRKKCMRNLDLIFHFQWITNLSLELWKIKTNNLKVSLQRTPRFPHVPGPAGELMQVFACRKTPLIREQTKQWKQNCRYFQVKPCWSDKSMEWFAQFQ